MRNILLLSLLLCGCKVIVTNPAPSPTPGASSTPTATPTPVPTATPTPPPVVTPTPTPKPTASPSPTPTATPKPTVTPTPTPSPASRPIVQVPASADLVAVLAKLQSNTIYQLAPKASYVISGGAWVTATHVSIDLNGSSLSLTAVGGSTFFMIKGAYFEIFNGSIVKAVNVMRSYADHTSIHDISTPDHAIDQLFNGDDGSTNALIDNVKIGITGSQAIYWTADNITVSNSTFQGSVGEDGIREEISTARHLPIGGHLTNLYVSNKPNVYQKGSISIRMGSVLIENSVIDGYIRAGQAASPSVGANVPNFIVKNCNFVRIQPGLPQLMIIDGVNGEIDGSMFATDATVSSVNVGRNSPVKLLNNVRKLSAPGVKPKKFTDSGGIPIEEINTVIQD